MEDAQHWGLLLCCKDSAKPCIPTTVHNNGSGARPLVTSPLHTDPHTHTQTHWRQPSTKAITIHGPGLPASSLQGKFIHTNLWPCFGAWSCCSHRFGNREDLLTRHCNLKVPTLHVKQSSLATKMFIRFSYSTKRTLSGMQGSSLSAATAHVSLWAW